MDQLSLSALLLSDDSEDEYELREETQQPQQVEEGEHPPPAQLGDDATVAQGGRESGQQHELAVLAQALPAPEGLRQHPEREEGEQLQQGLIPGLVLEEEGERLMLGPRVSPPVLPPTNTEALGWAAIAKLGAWDSFLSKFAVLEEVPEQHKGAWAGAWVEVLRRWERAETEEERDLALMWLGFLPQALLRRPTRGGRAGRREVAKRFLCTNQGD